MVDTEKGKYAMMKQLNIVESHMMEQLGFAGRQIMEHTGYVGQHIVTALQNNTGKTLENLKRILIDVHNQPQDGRLPVHPYPMDSRRIALPQLRNDSTISELNADNERLKELLEISEARISSFIGEVQARQQESRQQESRQQESRQQESRQLTSALRESRKVTRDLEMTMVEKVDDSEPTDYKVTESFRGVRHKIQYITYEYYLATTVSFPGPPNDSMTVLERREKWLGSWSRDSLTIRNCRVYGAIFEIIYTSFFSRPVFGVNEDLEKQLRLFESDMAKCSEISPKDLKDWRRRTVTAIKHMKSKDTFLSNTVAKEIRDTLEQALTQSPQNMTRDKVDQLEKDTIELCDKALECALMYRSMKRNVRVVVPEPNTKFRNYKDSGRFEQCEMLLMVSISGIIPEPIARVAFTLCGSIEMTRDIPGDKGTPWTMERAMVVGI